MVSRSFRHGMTIETSIGRASSLPSVWTAIGATTDLSFPLQVELIRVLWRTSAYDDPMRLPFRPASGQLPKPSRRIGLVESGLDPGDLVNSELDPRLEDYCKLIAPRLLH
jgi:hypothetical protein